MGDVTSPPCTLSGGGHNYDSSSIRLRFDCRSTAVRLLITRYEVNYIGLNDVTD